MRLAIRVSIGDNAGLWDNGRCFMVSARARNEKTRAKLEVRSR